MAKKTVQASKIEVEASMKGNVRNYHIIFSFNLHHRSNQEDTINLSQWEPIFFNKHISICILHTTYSFSVMPLRNTIILFLQEKFNLKCPRTKCLDNKNWLRNILLQQPPQPTGFRMILDSWLVSNVRSIYTSWGWWILSWSMKQSQIVIFYELLRWILFIYN